MVEHLVRKLWESTRHQYESTWSNFLAFLNLRKPETINVPLMTEFFSSMFERSYGVTTIRTAKSALAELLKEGFGHRLEQRGLQRPL